MKRLLEDAQLPSELRADLLRSRSAGQDYQTAAKLLQLRAAFSNSASPPAGAGVSTLKRAARRAMHPGWKLAVLAALGGGAAVLARPSPQVPSATLELPAAIITDPAAATAIAIEPLPSPALELAAASPAPETATALGVAELAPAANSSRREIAQLVRVRALLERDPAAAYRLAERSQREFPRGILAEERQALAIVALAKTGARPVAKQHARQFFARFPQSPMRTAIDAALR